MSLVQVGGVISERPTSSTADRSAQLGRIDSNGDRDPLEGRPVLDFTMRGQMDPTGTRISGGIFGSGSAVSRSSSTSADRRPGDAEVS
jgi:hypothetical protein